MYIAEEHLMKILQLETFANEYLSIQPYHYSGHFSDL